MRAIYEIAVEARAGLLTVFSWKSSRKTVEAVRTKDCERTSFGVVVQTIGGTNMIGTNMHILRLRM